MRKHRRPRDQFSVVRLIAALGVCVFVMAGCAKVPGTHGPYTSGSYYTGGGTVPVRGYFRRDGTYVRPHFRTAPDGIRSNNLSYGRRGGRR